MTGPEHQIPDTRPGPGPVRAPVDVRHPADDHERDPEERRTERLRQELGDTVTEVAHRLDVPARVRARRAATYARTRARWARAQSALDEKAPPVGRAVRERPTLVAGAAIAIPAALLLVTRLRRTRL